MKTVAFRFILVYNLHFLLSKVPEEGCEVPVRGCCSQVPSWFSAYKSEQDMLWHTDHFSLSFMEVIICYLCQEKKK